MPPQGVNVVRDSDGLTAVAAIASKWAAKVAGLTANGAIQSGGLSETEW